jgi:predicted HTH domain antitoxin
VTEAGLRELRCKSCGILLGHTYHGGRLVTWCSPDCAAVPLWENEERDELVAAMFLEGATTPEIAKRYGMTYQNVQQILKRWHIPLSNGYYRSEASRLAGQNKEGAKT